MFCGRCCATELRMKPALPLDIFIEILPGNSVNRGKSTGQQRLRPWSVG